MFNASISDAIQDSRVKQLRAAVDQRVAVKVNQTLASPTRLEVSNSAQFWYPAGAYMSWHTNSGAPGWRMYITHVDEPGKSFFRYRDADSGKIITSWDNTWNVRLFEIRADKPFWHAVYSATNRFSFGYVIQSQPIGRKLIRKLKHLLKFESWARPPSR